MRLASAGPIESNTPPVYVWSSRFVASSVVVTLGLLPELLLVTASETVPTVTESPEVALFVQCGSTELLPPCCGVRSRTYCPPPCRR